jgi:hypothetical protein
LGLDVDVCHVLYDRRFVWYDVCYGRNPIIMI